MLPFYQHEWLFLVKGRWIVILYKPFTNMKIFCLTTCLTLFPSIYLISFIGGNIHCIPLILLYLDCTSFTAPYRVNGRKSMIITALSSNFTYLRYVQHTNPLFISHSLIFFPHHVSKQ